MALRIPELSGIMGHMLKLAWLENDPRLEPYNLPVDPEWAKDEMLLRKAILLTGRRSIGSEELRFAVENLDSWAAEWGLARHGNLTSEPFDQGRQVGISAMFKIVDVAKFAAKTMERARDSQAPPA